VKDNVNRRSKSRGTREGQGLKGNQTEKNGINDGVEWNGMEWNRMEGNGMLGTEMYYGC
jgi:hypothetical protein